MRLPLSPDPGTAYRIEGSLDLVSWSAVVTLQGKGSDQFTDSQGPSLAARFYRTVPAEAATASTGDHIQTTNGAAREFLPRVVYPYHLRNSDNSLRDLNAFQRKVGFDVGVEVRKRKWYWHAGGSDVSPGAKSQALFASTAGPPGSL